MQVATLTSISPHDKKVLLFLCAQLVSTHYNIYTPRTKSLLTIVSHFTKTMRVQQYIARFSLKDIFTRFFQSFIDRLIYS